MITGTIVLGFQIFAELTINCLHVQGVLNCYLYKGYKYTMYVDFRCERAIKVGSSTNTLASTSEHQG